LGIVLENITGLLRGKKKKIKLMVLMMMITGAAVYEECPF